MRLSSGQVRVRVCKTKQISGLFDWLRIHGARTRNQRGFTLVELIAVIVIIGILAVAAAPRFFDRNTFDSRAFHDQVISMLRYAQKAAIAQRRFVCVTIAGNAVTLTFDTTPPGAAHTAAACGSDLTNPATGTTPYTVSAPSGVQVGNAAFNFDALGRASAAQNITISNASTITVVAETGYVR